MSIVSATNISLDDTRLSVRGQPESKRPVWHSLRRSSRHEGRKKHLPFEFVGDQRQAGEPLSTGIEALNKDQAVDLLVIGRGPAYDEPEKALCKKPFIPFN
jgi:hypothetical protein